MTRVLAFMGVFVLSIVGLLLLQPGNSRNLSSSDPSEVTRTNAETLLSTRLPEPQSETPAAVNNDTTTQLLALQKLQAATKASLSGEPAVTAGSNEMRSLTSNALANLRATVSGRGQTGQVRLASLVSRSMGTGQVDAFTSAIAREAKYGTEEYDKLAMVSADRDSSDVKTRWIENARKQSKAMADATAFMTSGTNNTPGFDDTIHIVKKGDSLMKLSIRYYGRTIDYQLIFEANRDVLLSPDKISIGQKLKIPPVNNV